MELLLIYSSLALFIFVSSHRSIILQGIFGLSYSLLTYYTDPNEKVKITLAIQTLAFSSVLLYITLVPFDVYATVNHFATLVLGFKLYDLYFSTLFISPVNIFIADYILMIVLVFFLLPFSYFYAE